MNIAIISTWLSSMVLVVTGLDLLLDMDKTMFQAINLQHTNATKVPQSKHQWIAKVVHSTIREEPLMCTATCIEHQIFITAARCLESAKVNYTTLIYSNTRLKVRVFVIPSDHSKQWFDDIGIIVTEVSPKFRTWHAIALTPIKRYKSERHPFKWFEDYKYDESPIQHKVVAYAYVKSLVATNYAVENAEAELVELPVKVGVKLCEKIFSAPESHAFRVPCYHHCNSTEYFSNLPKCRRHIDSEGGAVINTNSKTINLLGVAYE